MELTKDQTEQSKEYGSLSVSVSLSLFLIIIIIII